jgi:hypothetical protein
MNPLAFGENESRSARQDLQDSERMFDQASAAASASSRERAGSFPSWTVH